MNLIFTGIFWSVVLILLGIGIIINVTLRTRIPFFRILAALLLVYVGLSLLFGRPWSYHRDFHRHGRTREKTVLTGESGKYDIVFGSSEIDLTKVELKNKTLSQEIDVVFGSGQVKVDPQMPVRVEVSSAFADVQMPGGGVVAFGDQTWHSPSYDEAKPHLLIKADVVFGELEVVGENSAAPEPADSTKKAES